MSSFMDAIGEYLRKHRTDMGAAAGAAIRQPGAVAGAAVQEMPGTEVASRLNQAPMTPMFDASRKFFDGLHADREMQGIRRDNITAAIQAMHAVPSIANPAGTDVASQ